MRLFRLYWIPGNADPTAGAYVRDRYRDLIGILALESARNQVVIIGEDLGTVEPQAREILARAGILSYRLLYFERNPGGEFRQPQEYPEQALVSCTTHDLPTLAGFWAGHDIEIRRQAGLFPDDATFEAQRSARLRDKQALLDALSEAGVLPPECPRLASQIPELTGALHNAVIGFLALAPCRLLAVNQEDLTKELAQQNLPGTTSEYPNWSRKMRYSLEELRESPARDFTRMLRDWVERSGRFGGHASGTEG